MLLRDFLEFNGLFRKKKVYLLENNINLKMGGLFIIEKLKVF